LTRNAPQGDVAQLAEHLLCKQGVVGSSPIVSTGPKALVKPYFCGRRRPDRNLLGDPWHIDTQIGV
jgi:hypothetical protein